MNTIIDLKNKKWNKQELVDNMYSDEFYYSAPLLGYSDIKNLLKSPKWFAHKLKKKAPETQALRDGRLIHAQILEPDTYQQFHFCDVQSKNTKKYKLAQEQYGKANTFTVKEKYMNNRVSDAFQQNNTAMSYLRGNETEVPNVMMEGAMPIRGKADILGPDFVADVKTTASGVKDIVLKSGENTNQFAFTIESYDYDLQAYLYTKLFDKKDFYWLVIDKLTTDIGIFKASDETLQRGADKYEACVQMYNAFFIDELIDLSQYHTYREI
jgi:hypothetical protein